jgi:hypothetical protein
VNGVHTRIRRLSTRATYLVVCVVVVLAVLARLPFLRNSIYPDEGGMLVVAREWHTGGPYLYGDLFLARPPLILAFFRLAGELDGLMAVRIMGLVLVAIIVASAAWAGSSLAGRRGAVTAALVSAAYMTNPMLGSREVDAETVGVPFGMAATACFLAAYRRPRGTAGRAWLLVAGGTLAACALLAKQNLADSLAFGVVLVVGAALVERGERRSGVRDVGWLALGIAVPVVITVIWAETASAGVHELVYELFGFRAEGGQTLLAQPTDSQNARLHNLIDCTFRSGLIPVAVASLWLLRRRWWRDPVTLGLLAMTLTAVVGVAGGGQYWIHYALGLVPVTAVLAAYAVGKVPAPRLVGALVAASVVITGYHVHQAISERKTSDETWVGGTTTWLDQMKRPGDSMVVLYGQAGLYENAGIRPAYPYLWTLPMRVLDPDLDDLRALLSGPDAPTFVLAPLSLDSWDIDTGDRLQTALIDHYHWVATVCGTPVFMRNGLDRPVAPSPETCLKT